MIEPIGDADFPMRGLYWEMIYPVGQIGALPDMVPLDANSFTRPVPGVTVTPGDWASGEYEPMKPSGDY